jgi:hypothetical protein
MRLLLHGLIADVLLERAAKGDDSLGLEIAWHCMRCGRKEEATRHLLSGARVAIRKGAVHEAERRLGSSLLNLQGTPLTEATLLLAELLQEQSRWSESIAALATLQAALDSEEGVTLAGIASANMSYDPQELLRLASTCSTRLSAGPENGRSALSLLGLGAHVVARLRDPHWARHFLALLEDLAPASSRWSVDEQFQWRTLRVFLGYRAGAPSFDTVAIYHELAALVRLTNAKTSPNKRSVRLISGLGLCSRRMGLYREAYDLFCLGGDLANRLGDNEGVANLLNSAAYVLYCLGDYERQLRMAEEAARHFSNGFAGLTEFNNTKLLAGALLLNGEVSAADDLVRKRSSRIPHALPPWLKQVWLFCRADLARAADRSDDAKAFAIQALQIGNGAALDVEETAIVARWHAALLEDVALCRQSSAALVALSPGTAISDVWDRAELLSALTSNEDYLQLTDGPARRELKNALAGLPAGAAIHLARFGLPTN